MKNFEEEKLYLEKVKNRIIEEREEQIKLLETIPLQFKGRYSDVKWGDEDLVKDLTTKVQDRLNKIENLENKPYFGSFTFFNEDNNINYRIGKTDIYNNSLPMVLDWRNPICTLYYDKSVGPVSYQAPKGIIKGDLLNKRQILIENGRLISLMDVDLVSNDELLQKYLNINADNRMKTIIASIQAEQNSIIRKPIEENLIIQGVAGSGKTSVALHRIAYLLYNNKNLFAKDFVIIGPNKFFLDYISSVLPDLDSKNANEYTFDEIAKLIIDDNKYNIETTNEELDDLISKNNQLNYAKKIKGTLNYKDCLNKFLKDYWDACLNDGIKFENIDLITSLELKRNIDINTNYKKTINNYIKIKSKKIKDNYEEIYFKLVEPLMIEMKQYPIDSIERDSVIKRMDTLKIIIKNGCLLELKKALKPLLISPINIYKLFLENIDKYINCDEKTLNSFKDSLKKLKKKIIPNEDLAAICYLSLLQKGYEDNKNIKHVIIDEAQDYNLLQFFIIKNIYKKSTYSIFGDLAQSIYSYRAIESWEELNNKIFNNNCEVISLLNSYRTTREITTASNYILEELNLSLSNPVLRSGEDVNFTNAADYENNLYYEKISEYLKSNYKSLGIICKNEYEMIEIKNILDELNIDYNYIDTTEKKYKGGISLLTAYLAKGLEFDSVIIADASEEKYNSTSNIDNHLLYVAMTRGLHKLDIIYNKNLNNILFKLKKDLKTQEHKKLIKK